MSFTTYRHGHVLRCKCGAETVKIEAGCQVDHWTEKGEHENWRRLKIEVDGVDISDVQCPTCFSRGNVT